MSNLSNTLRVFFSLSCRVSALFAALAFFICFAAVQSASAAAFVVTTTADSGAGSLRAAITAANTNAQPDTITFNIPTGSAGCTGLACTVTLTTGELPILNDGAGNTVTIDGSGVNRVTISGGGNSRVFFVTNSASLSLINLTVTDGSSNFGGGLYNDGGTLDLNGVTVSGNTVTASGGGIYTTGATGNTTLTNSTVSGNTSKFSGGIQIDRGGVLNLTNSTITNNSASSTSDGAAAGGVVAFGTVNVKNTIIAGNTQSVSPDVRGFFTSQGYNLIGNTTGSSGFSAANNDILNPAGGAMLGALADNGGKTDTHALLYGQSGN